MFFTLNAASLRGLKVIPLDTERRWAKHYFISSKLDNLIESIQKHQASGLSEIEISDEDIKSARNFWVHTYTRSQGMGLKLKRENIPVNFMGNLHAWQLSKVLSQTHEVELSPHSHLSPDKIFETSSEFIPLELRLKLDGMLQKNLSP